MRCSHPLLMRKREERKQPEETEKEKKEIQKKYTEDESEENMINKMNLINTLPLIKNNQSCIAFPYFHTINKQVTIYYN